LIGTNIDGEGVSRMKKALSVLAAVVMLLSGCGEDEGSESTESFGMFKSADSIAKEKGKEFMDYLIAGDSESIKNMFCQRTLQLADFDEQFQAAIEFIDGNIISYGKLGSGGTGEYTRNGKITVMDVTPYIEDIVTDTGKTYRIIFYMFIYFDGHEDVIGITKLAISLMENNEEKDFCEVGKIIHKVDVW